MQFCKYSEIPVVLFILTTDESQWVVLREEGVL